MRAPSPALSLFGLALACSAVPGVAQMVDPDITFGGDDDDSGDTGDSGATDSGEHGWEDDDSGGDDTPAAILHPYCDAYLACLAEVSPEQSAAASAAYGYSSECWDSESSAAACEAECAAALHEQWVQNPGAQSCDDGTDIPSNTVILQSTWSMSITEVEGPMCDSWFSYVTSYTITFSPNDTAEFPGTFNGSGWSNTIDCENNGLDISCWGVADALVITFDGEISEDFARLSGVYADDVYCFWTLESG
ncbi:MAG: hypothetical protein FJ090_06470 [Deltaproteobacteria bacterium]|nr:hypothetical protein [Deltaproteobacteria bacterium]